MENSAGDPNVQPPFAAYGSGPPVERKANVAAIVSLVLGIVGCVPYLCSILAIILGIVGMRKARHPNTGGKGFAVAGLILGILGVIGWSILGGTVYMTYLASKPGRAVASQFLQAASQGNTSQVQAVCTPAVQPSQIPPLIAYVQKAGTFQDLTCYKFQYNVLNGAAALHLEGTATYSGGTQYVIFDLIESGGQWKINSFSVN